MADVWKRNGHSGKNGNGKGDFESLSRDLGYMIPLGTAEELEDALDGHLEKLLRADKDDNELKVWRRDFDAFKQLYHKFLHSRQKIDWEKLEPLPDGFVRPYAALAAPADGAETAALLDKLVVLKLNGGLGTSMGCRGPKSVVTVRDDLMFLDFVVMQMQHLNSTHKTDVPLVLMDSYNTDADTARVLRRKYPRLSSRVLHFNQSRCPRISADTLLPVAASLDDHAEVWYPPGHGDVYRAFYASGLLQEMLDKGREVCFVSNVDNAAAAVDLKILKLMLEGDEEERLEYLMEVTDKTPADIKGGTVIGYDGRLLHLEMSQVPKDHADEFNLRKVPIKPISIFNTNNIWINLRAAKRFIEERKADLAEIVINPKRIHNGTDVIQLETSIGGTIKNFSRACCVNVPRLAGRFLPVKKTQDLLIVMSNLCEIADGQLAISAIRLETNPTMPLIKLGSSFNKVSDFLRRFKGQAPDLLGLNHLTVSGDVWFGKQISLKGTVIIIANQGERIDIPDGSVLENKIVSGNLRVLDH